MESEYLKLTSELDAREILRYLNQLGIHNISGEVLKHFITDLKKLIKYDLQQKNENLCEDRFEFQWPERLHSASTFASRIRSKTSESNSLTCCRQFQRPRQPLSMRNIQSAPNIGMSEVEKPLRRACSCVRVEKKQDVKESRAVPSSNNNLIKVPVQATRKKCDPVSLYHYYTALWAKYKQNVPGENDWADLRWNVRQKMAGSLVAKSNNKVPELQSRDKNIGQCKKL